MATRDASAPSIGPAQRQRAAAASLRSLAVSLERTLEAERNQLPLWIPVGLLAGVLAWFALPDPAAWIGWIAGWSGLALAGRLLAAGSRLGKAIGLFAAMAAIGCALIWWRAESVSAPVLDRPQMMEFTGRIERVQPLAAEKKVRLILSPEGEGPARLRVSLTESDHRAEFRPGARLRIKAWMMPPPRAAAPGGYDFARAAWFQRIGGTGKASRITLLSAAPENGLGVRFSELRNRLAAHVRAALPDAGEGGIAAALATGDQYGIPEEDAEAMRRSGLAHLLSVSGLHLTALVAAIMFLTIKLLALSPTLALRFPLMVIAAGAGAVGGIFYTLLTGAEVPTVRACIASLLVLAGIALGRDSLTLRLVAVGALVILLLWPENVVGPSFQLSFAAIIAIVALHEHPRIQALLRRREEGMTARAGRILLGLVLTGLAVEAALIPIALFHFHKAGLYGAAANVIAIPLTTFVVMPLEAMALLFDLLGLGAPFWWATGKGLALLLWLAHHAASAPGAVTTLPAIPNAAFAMTAAGGLWLALWRTKWRRIGWLPILAGMLWSISVRPPDLLVTSDGRHLLARTPAGELAMLRPRAGDYVRDTLSELAGEEAEFVSFETLPASACSRDLCALNMERDGRRWSLLAIRSRHFIRWYDMVRACAAADLVVSDLRLPRGCRPRWLKIEPWLLRRTGGLSIRFGTEVEVRTAIEPGDRHPWNAVKERGGR